MTALVIVYAIAITALFLNSRRTTTHEEVNDKELLRFGRWVTEYFQLKVNVSEGLLQQYKDERE